MTELFLDLETIPTRSEAAKQRIASSVKPPAQMTKADTIAAWEKDKKAGAVEEAIAKSSLNGAYGHICTIAFAIDDEPAQSVHWPSKDIDDERTALKYFSTFASTVNRTPQIIGHNILDFDLRFLWQRAMVLSVQMPTYMPWAPKPWTDEVFDTMKAWAGVKGYISLDELAFALGIEGKNGIDGSMVAGMFEAGEHEAIAQYARDDVDLTRKIYRKMKLAIR